MSSEKRKIAYIDGKPYEIGPNHSSILKFVKSYVVRFFVNQVQLLHIQSLNVRLIF